MRVLIAPDKFKGSLSAVQAAEAIARGWLAGWPGSTVELAPIADGGEGFAEVFQRTLAGEWVKQEVQDPLGRPVEGKFVWLEREQSAVLEMSEASGLWRLTADELAPLEATTCGTGELMRAAIEKGARRILVGLGGSATTDGGAGMASALGLRFLDRAGEELAPRPRHFARFCRIDATGAVPLPEIVAACDVTNPLLGEHGTARVFAPQKGADTATVESLERGLSHLADLAQHELGRDFREAPGAGAAGGLGWGLMTFCGASLRSGFDLVAEALRLPERMAAADLVITGEGRLDYQTAQGKGPAGVAEMARRANKPVLALAGSVENERSLGKLFTATLGIVDRPITLEEAIASGAELLERAAHRAADLVKIGQLFG